MMITRLILFLMVLVLCSIPARADQVAIIHGTVQLGGGPVSGNTRWDISGSGFNASGGADRNNPFLEPCGGVPCTTGTISTNISFGFVTAEYIFSASASFNGVGISVSGGIHPQPPSLFTAMQFFGSVDVPIVTEDSITVDAPFTMTGRVGGQGPVGSGIVLDVTFTGSGIATYRFTPMIIAGPNPGPLYVWRSTTYNFSEVPEPATLLLLGTSLSGLVAYNYRRRKNDSV